MTATIIDYFEAQTIDTSHEMTREVAESIRNLSRESFLDQIEKWADCWGKQRSITEITSLPFSGRKNWPSI